MYFLAFYFNIQYLYASSRRSGNMMPKGESQDNKNHSFQRKNLLFLMDFWLTFSRILLLLHVIVMYFDIVIALTFRRISVSQPSPTWFFVKFPSSDWFPPVLFCHFSLNIVLLLFYCYTSKPLFYYFLMLL